jgi:4-hydroxy-3-methylbut-2-enyl diphosphate reductase
MSQIIPITPRGFCQGVIRAIKLLENQTTQSKVDFLTTKPSKLEEDHSIIPSFHHTILSKNSNPVSDLTTNVFALNEIVHNQSVVQQFRNQGVRFISFDQVQSDPDQVKDSTVVLSAHGTDPAVRECLDQLPIQVIDATCPLVENVHRLVRKYAALGYWVILIGKAGHEETQGILGESNRVILVETIADVHTLADKLIPPAAEPAERAPSTEPATETPASLIWVSQTTLSVDDTQAIVDELHKSFPQIIDPQKSCICYATQERQQAVKDAAQQHELDLLLVIGSPNSSNSNRLVEVGRAAGIEEVRLIEGPQDLDFEQLRQYQTIGITAGASTPETIVQQVIRQLSIDTTL